MPSPPPHPSPPASSPCGVSSDDSSPSASVDLFPCLGFASRLAVILAIAEASFVGATCLYLFLCGEDNTAPSAAAPPPPQKKPASPTARAVRYAAASFYLACAAVFVIFILPAPGGAACELSQVKVLIVPWSMDGANSVAIDQGVGDISAYFDAQWGILGVRLGGQVVASVMMPVWHALVIATYVWPDW